MTKNYQESNPATPPFSSLKKPLWDWLDLLIVPVILFIGGTWFSHTSEQTQQRIANERYQQELYRGYLDQISTLILDHDLKEAEEFSETRMFANSLTTSTLQDLEEERRNSLMRFLRSTGLATPEPGSEMPGGILRRGNLSNMDLSGTIMNAIDLQYARLENSDLTHAFLGAYADLRYAQFINTSLTNTDFENADIDEAVFAYTNLETAKNLTDEQLATAKICNTVLPNGSESDRDCDALIRQQLCNVAPPPGVDPSTFEYPDCDAVTREHINSGNLYSPQHSWDERIQLQHQN